MIRKGKSKNDNEFEVKMKRMNEEWKRRDNEKVNMKENGWQWEKKENVIEKGFELKNEESEWMDKED